jgi:Zn-dependent peptidase ImmA (M78 family)
VNNAFPLERPRLTLGHELAHRLIDTDSLSDKEEEKGATVFAGVFLMPRDHRYGKSESTQRARVQGADRLEAPVPR